MIWDDELEYATIAEENPLIAREKNFDIKQETQLAEERILILNPEQQTAFDCIWNSVKSNCSFSMVQVKLEKLLSTMSSVTFFVERV